MSHVIESESSCYEIRAQWPTKLEIPDPQVWDQNYVRVTWPGCAEACAQANALSKTRGLYISYNGSLASRQAFTDLKKIQKVAAAVKQVGFVDVKIREEKTSIVLHEA